MIETRPRAAAAPAVATSGPEAPAPNPAPGWLRALPNVLTVLRLALAAAFPWIGAAWRLPAVVASAVSDGLDGWIARRFGATSVLGAILDGIADKAFVISVLGTLLLAGDVAAWQAGVVLLRDATVAFTFAYVLVTRRWGAFEHMDARLPGKLTTMFLFAWFAALLIAPARPAAGPLFWAGAVCSVWAAVDYAVRFVGLLRGTREG